MSVQCDEGRPHCLACKRRSTECKYARADDLEQRLLDMRRRPVVSKIMTTPSFESSLPAFGPTPDQAFDRFDMFDMRLYSHFLTSVVPTLTEMPTQPLNWSTQVQGPAFNHPLTIHAALSLSAIHLSRCDASVSIKCAEKGVSCHAAALTLMIDILPALDDHNIGSLFLGGVLLCIFNTAYGPRHGQYLAFSDDSSAEFIWLIKGVRSMLLSSSSRELCSMLRVIDPGEVMPLDLIPGYQDYVEKLHAQALRESEGDAKVYEQTIDALRDCYNKATADPTPDGHIASHHIFTWLYFLDPAFLILLQDKRPLALLIFAYFDVLLHHCRHIWYLEPWAAHIMAGIHRHLKPENRPLLEWPCKEISWLPPDAD